ncbi:MAG: hypothetical protein ACTSRG_13845 [Candidatus Helarchaeota archaeon]
MPIGLVVFTWDDRIGAEVKAKVPVELEVPEQTLKQIYSSHFLEESGGFLSLIIGALNVASYYTGTELSYFVSLLLTIDEDPDNYEDAIIDAARYIITNMENDRYMEILPSIYDRISLYPSFEDEQKLALAYTDEVKRLIINRLVEDGSATKNDILNWLKEKLNLEYLDIDGILNSLVKLGLVKVASVKGLPSDSIFLTNDVFITRTPPAHIIKQAKGKRLSATMGSEYLSNVRAYFERYKPSLDDEKIIADIVADTDTYTILNLLRLSPVTKRGFDKVKKKVKDLDKALKKIWSAGMVQVLKDKSGEEYYFLKTDIRIEKFYPEYMIDVIRNNYNNRTMANPVLLEHLRNLKAAYETQYKIKKKKEEED